MDLIEQWRTTAEGFDLRHGAITDDQWDTPTPCSEWVVRQVVDHVVSAQGRFGAMLGADVPEEATWPEVRDAMTAALADDSVLARTVTVPGLGDLSGRQILEICTYDLLIHTWDLARAIGADETLPPDVVVPCHAWLQGLPVEILRSSGRFSDAVDTEAEADEQARMLAFAGRKP
jgi:uncharacterized protein (TIGR03086 family)